MEFACNLLFIVSILILYKIDETNENFTTDDKYEELIAFSQANLLNF